MSASDSLDLPADVLAAIEECWAHQRESGVLVTNLGGGPIYASQVRRALQVRFALDGEALDFAEERVRTRIAKDLSEAQVSRREPSAWVFGWKN